MAYKPVQTIEEIYPLTIIKMRFGGKIVILNVDSDASCVSSIQGDEEVFYDVEKFMEDQWEFITYGIGKTLVEAFLDYQERETLQYYETHDR